MILSIEACRCIKALVEKELIAKEQHTDQSDYTLQLQKTLAQLTFYVWETYGGWNNVKA